MSYDPTIEEVRELCEDYGLKGVGPDSDMLRFLRDRLGQVEDLETQIDRLERSPFLCSFCLEADAESRRLRLRLEDFLARCECAARRELAPDFKPSNLEDRPAAGNPEAPSGKGRARDAARKAR